MNYQVTRTKIIPPRRRSDLLSRQRLLDTLYELIDFRLIIIIAPAGYGKTFLLVDFAHNTELPVCWCALDPLDHDLYRFFAHFIAAIAEQFSGFGRASTAALENLANRSSNLEQFITTVVNEIYEQIHEHFVLILDDFFLVEENPDISYFISRLVQQVDENCHIILSSRKLVNIPDMALLIARGYVAGMDHEDLAYEREELQALTEKSYGYTMPDEEAESLIDATDGWIIGLLLSAQSKLRSISGRMRLMRASGIDLYDYLAVQVLNQQPVVIQDFLLRTSLLEEFDATLCHEILGEEWRPSAYSWDALIAEVLRRNLFVLPLGDESSWLRYNHVFRDFLQKRLMKVHPDEEQLILERLAMYYQRHREWEKAHYYLNRLEDFGDVADLVESAGISLLYTGRVSLLQSWLEQLPTGFLQERPMLLSLQGDILTRRGEFDQGLIYLTAAAEQLQMRESPANFTHTLMRRAVAHRLLGNYAEALQDTDRVLELLELSHLQQGSVETPVPEDAQIIGLETITLAKIHALALRSKGTIFCAIGKAEVGIALLQQALTAYEEIGEPYSAASIMQDTALSYLQLGRHGDALTLFNRALQAWQDSTSLSGQALVFNNIGYLHYLQGDYETALRHLEQALDHTRRSGYMRMMGYVLISIGDIFTDLELWTAARDIYQRAIPITQQINEQYLFLALELAFARLASLQEDWEAVYVHLDTASELVINRKSAYEWALYRLAVGRCTFLQKRPADALEALRDAQDYFAAGSQPIEAAATHFLLAAATAAAGEEYESTVQLQTALDITTQLESRHAVLTTLRLIRPYLQTKHILTLDPLVSELVAELDAFEQAIPKQNRLLRQVASPALSSILSKEPQFRIYALGRVEVTIGEKSLTTSDWQTIVSRDLFLCLLARPEGLTKEQIGLLFWPDASPSELKTRFKNAIYRLRNALRRNVVLYTNDIYHYNWAIDYQYDVEEFLQKVGEGDKTTDVAERIDAYRRAIALYRGPYLPTIEDAWALSTREYLQRIFIDTALALAELYQQRQQFSEALAVCQQILAQDPCLEDAHRLAMQIHATQGNRAAVVRQFSLCQQALHNEVEVTPSPQTEELYATLMH